MPLSDNHTTEQGEKMQIRYIVIHCSDTPNDREVTAADIHRWHSDPKPKGNGWSGIGYHAVIRRDGTLEMGRPDYWPGAHVQAHNSNSIGICLIGRDQFNERQLLVAEGYILNCLAKYPGAEVVGHTDLDPRKTCPNFDVRAWWASRKKNHID